MDAILWLLVVICYLIVYFVGYAHGRISRITTECISQIIEAAIETSYEQTQMTAQQDEPPRTLKDTARKIPPVNTL